jgi:SAM-dependent methyltransferase
MKREIIKTYDLLGQDYFDMRKEKRGISYFYNELVDTPTTLKLLGTVRGKKILDLGCGPGFYLNKLKKKEANVQGIELSTELIRLAKQLNPDIEIKKGDITKRLPYQDKAFDAVMSTLVLGHIKNWDFTLKEVYRILKNNGIFIFTIGVPFYECVRRIKINGKKFKTPSDYFNERAIHTTWCSNGKEGKTIHYHKTYGTIIKLLIKNNFEILDYEDCKPILKAKKIYPKEFGDEMDFPRFCAWKVKKK